MKENFIKKISIENIDNNKYFSNVEGLNKFQALTFDSPITFFSGENGTGKSTLLEAIAINLGFNAEGGSKNFNFSANDTHSKLYESLRITKGSRRATDGFFLRSESFYNLATYAEEIGLDFSEYGDKSIHQQSRGEGVFNLINHRFRGNGVYLLDEPDSGLSLQKQLSLLVSLHHLTENGSQFIIATHSPILLAMPDAKIISFDSNSPIEISYEESTAYEVIDLFLNSRESMISQLFKNTN